MTERDEARSVLVKRLTDEINELAVHHATRASTPEAQAEIRGLVHATLTRLQNEGMLPGLNLGEIRVAVHKEDLTRFVVTFPSELTPLFEEAQAARAAAIEASHAEPEPEYSFYKSVYDRDNPKGEAHGWIQWKGTNVCMDVHCECGHHGHIDDEFFYFYECVKCGAKFAVGQNVKLIKLDERELEHAKNGVGFKKGD